MDKLEIKAYEAIDESNKTCWVVIAPGRNKVFSNFDNFKNYLKELENSNYILSQDVRNQILKMIDEFPGKIACHSGLGTS